MSANHSNVNKLAPTKIGIIAPDLIQAVNSIENCRYYNSKPTVILNSQIPENLDATAIVAMSKIATPRVSYLRTKTAIAKLHSRYQYLYESHNLMGNFSADIKAVIDGLQPEKLIVCTAWAERNIHIKEAVSYHNGVLAHKSLMAADAITPIKESNISTIVKKYTGLNPKCIGIADVEKGSAHIIKLIQGCRETVIVCDATKPHHLTHIAEAAVKHKDSWVACGSGGLIRAMGPYLGYTGTGHAISPIQNKKPVLLVLGSMSNVTAVQLAAATEQGMVHPILIEPSDFWHRNEREHEILNVAREVSEQLSKGKNVAITSTYSRFIPQFRRTVSYLLSSIAEIVIGDCNIKTIFISGADTAYALCKTLEIQKLEVEGSITGKIFPVMTNAYTSEGATYRLCLKSGAVWDELTIIQALQFLRQN